MFAPACSISNAKLDVKNKYQRKTSSHILGRTLKSQTDWQIYTYFVHARIESSSWKKTQEKMRNSFSYFAQTLAGRKRKTAQRTVLKWVIDRILQQMPNRRISSKTSVLNHILPYILGRPSQHVIASSWRGAPAAIHGTPCIAVLSVVSLPRVECYCNAQVLMHWLCPPPPPVIFCTRTAKLTL